MFQRAPNGLILVRFEKSYMSYQNGQTAGFIDQEAEMLELRGIARRVRAQRPIAEPARLEPVDRIRPNQQGGSEHLMSTDPNAKPGDGAEEEVDDDTPLGDRAEQKPIPDGWEELSAKEMVALAKSLGYDVTRKVDAQAAIEMEIETRRQGQP